jgi:hypothetical protein
VAIGIVIAEEPAEVVVVLAVVAIGIVIAEEPAEVVVVLAVVDTDAAERVLTKQLN